MRQRNDTGHVQDVMAWPTDADPGRHPFAVGPGQEIDFAELLAGFTPLDAPAAECASDADAERDVPAKPAKSTARTKSAASAAAPGGSEPQ